MQQNSFIANLMSAQHVMLCVTQPGHITHSPAPDQQPANQSVMYHITQPSVQSLSS